MRSLVFALLITLSAAFNGAVPGEAAAASALFRVKRSWFGPPTPAVSTPKSYVSPYYHPPTMGPGKAPPAQCYIYIDTVPLPECGPIPSKVIQDLVSIRSCFPFGCRSGYPVSVTYPSYWNLEGHFLPSNPYAATTTTTVVFPTTMGNPYPPLATGDPTSATTTFSGRYDFNRSGSIMITPGKNRFGGTLRFLGGPNQQYYQLITASSPYISKAYGTSTYFPKLSRRHETILGVILVDHALNRFRMTSMGDAKLTIGTPSAPGDFYVQRVQYVSTAAPWTTGMVTVAHINGPKAMNGPLATTDYRLIRSGYDNRTSSGFYGVVSLVRPRIVHSYIVPHDPGKAIRKLRTFSEIWQVDVHFLPEPVGVGILVVGFVVLACAKRFHKG